ncbi:MAG: serine/threonine protein kinase [Phycisphaerales bacterium]|nr:serine/threonine protein kinase [Phycisphaerales bacterium]
MAPNFRTDKRGDADQAHCIQEVVNRWLKQRDAGVDIESELIEQHPDLLPELRDELQKAKMLAIAHEASLSSSSSEALSGCEAGLKEDQRLLEAALTSYRIIRRIDFGGQGAVYQAVQKATNRHVAIKVLLDGPLASEIRMRRFEREVKLISRLRHQNIVTLHDSGVVNGRPYFVMEFVDGVPIDDHILYHLPTVDDCVRLFVKVCRALAYAHQRGIIHRDLKPANILIDMSGEPKLLDFGLAKALHDEFEEEVLSITTPGRVVGTLPFLSPEQVEEHEEVVDVRTDIYSLGVILYRLLSGAFPYPVDVGTTAVYKNIVHADPVSLRKRIAAGDTDDRCTKGDIKEDLDHIVLKALAKEKDRRYQSVLELADDLDRYLRGEAVEARADGGLYIFKKTLRRYRIHVASLCAILVVLFVASVFSTKQWLTAREEREEATSQREIARQVADIAQLSLDDFIGEVIDSIGSLAGSSAVQDKLLEIVRERYAQLMPLVESDTAMNAIRTRIHERLGEMAAKQGHHTEAEQNYRVFLGVHEALTSNSGGNHELELAKMRVLRKLAEVAEDRANEFENAIAFGERFLSQNVGSRDAEYELSKTKVAFAKFLFKTGHYESAIEQLESTVNLEKSTNGQPFQDEKWMELLTDAYQWHGESQVKLGDGDAGIPSLEKSQRLREWLVNQAPANIQRRHRLRESYMRLGTILRDDGKFEDAEQLYDKAMQIGKYLMSADPKVLLWKYESLITLDRLIKLLLRKGELEVVQRHVDDALKLSAEIVSAEPNNRKWRRFRTAFLIHHGKLLYKQKEWALAYESFLSACATREMISWSDETDVSIRVELATAHDWFGRCSAKLGNHNEALEHLLIAYDLRRNVVRERPEVFKHLLACVVSQIHLSSWHLERETEEHDRNAEAYINDAQTTLITLHGTGKPSTLQHRYELYRKLIENNTAIICERSAKRSADANVDE